MSDIEAGLRLRRLWLFIGWVLVMFSVTVSLNDGGLPVVSDNINDKLVHMTGYGGLMFWFAQIYFQNKSRLIAAALLITMGVVLEFIQGATGIRVFEVADMVANTAGVFVGGLLALMGLDKILLWFERRIIYRKVF